MRYRYEEMPGAAIRQHRDRGIRTPSSGVLKPESQSPKPLLTVRGATLWQLVHPSQQWPPAFSCLPFAPGSASRRPSDRPPEPTFSVARLRPLLRPRVWSQSASSDFPGSCLCTFLDSIRPRVLRSADVPLLLPHPSAPHRARRSLPLFSLLPRSTWCAASCRLHADAEIPCTRGCAW